MPVTAPDAAAGTGQFGILFICTGNLCQSVIAERLARRGLHARLGADASWFRVASAGTAALDGCPVHPYTAEVLSWLGADADGAASHALTAAEVDATDLILAAGKEHKDTVVAMCPRASRCTYLLREFARVAPFASGTAMSGNAAGPPAADGLADWPAAGRLVAGRPAAGYSAVAQARHLVAEVAQLRGQVPYVQPAEDEIADPATSTAAFLECARVIDAAVSQSLDAFCDGLTGAPYRGKHAR